MEQYKKSVHTQEAEDRYAIWPKQEGNVLISPGGCFRGTKEIHEGFLLNCIRKAYTRIDLISKETTVRKLTDSTAIVVFEYVTDCIRRENGEPFALGGIETQVYVLEDGNWKLAHVQYSGKAIEA